MEEDEYIAKYSEVKAQRDAAQVKIDDLIDVVRTMRNEPRDGQKFTWSEGFAQALREITMGMGENDALLRSECEECAGIFYADYPGDLYCEDCVGLMTVTLADTDPAVQSAIDILKESLHRDLGIDYYKTGGKDG